MNVSAEEIKWCTDEGLSDVDVSQRYGITFTSNGGNSYKLKMDPPSNKTERCKMTFHVAQINGTDQNIEQHLSCDNELNLEINDTTTDTAFGLPGIIIKVDSDDKMIKNEQETNSCYYQGGSVTLELTTHLDSKKTVEQCPEIKIEETSLNIPSIDCNNSYAKGSFEYNFCYAKTHASKTFDFSQSGGKYSGTYKDLTFKCEYNLDSGKVPMKEEDLKGEKYYVNKNYIYGKSNETITLGNYSYYYSPGKVVQGNAISCDVTCEEAVEVEYGPPVASKAGMCFEYKVRVTSRTSCNMTKAPEKPKLDCDYCTPTPECTSKSGKVWKQGGPSEDFDLCVKSCDNGKYTKSCSEECYKKIYGSKEIAADKLDIKTSSSYKGSLSDCLALNPGGCYTKDSNGNIEWTAGSSPIRGGEGRWYSEHEGGTYHNGHYILDSRGFWRRLYENGNLCQDSCSWGGCSGDVYLNPGMAAKDYERNIELYNEAVTSCKAKATCSTTTAEFTISADYTPEGGKEININFPYETKKDTITHSSSTVIDTTSSKDTTLLPDEPKEGEGLLGCYKKNDNATNLYRSTWSFPGTWINGKTGEISFVPKTTSTSWREYKDKFCIPADAERVNSSWWNWYYNKLMNINNIKVSVTSDPVISNKCGGNTANTVVNPGPVTDKDIVWNIHARTNKFGYFDWLIQMDCFYALNPKPTTPTTTSPTTKTEQACDPTPENYRVRTIDLEDVFPATDGSKITETTSAGRTPGFNWSSYAENTKNENYISKPQKYMEKIQSIGYGVYKDDNLDYEFTLSPNTIRDMRKSSSNANYTGTNYTNFDDSGFFIDENGVSRYKSSKIRGIEANSKIPNDKAIQCNNMINYKSSNCEIIG